MKLSKSVSISAER